MKNHTINLRVSLILLIIYTATYLIDLLTFRSITISAFILCEGALLAYILFLRKLDPLYYLGILGFTFCAQYLGAMLKVYVLFPPYDKIIHGTSGILLVFLADYVYDHVLLKSHKTDLPRIIRLSLCGMTAIACAGLWEIWEFSGDQLFALTSQLGLADTMGDIIAGSIGAGIGVLILWRTLRKREQQGN